MLKKIALLALPLLAMPIVSHAENKPQNFAVINQVKDNYSFSILEKNDKNWIDDKAIAVTSKDIKNDLLSKGWKLVTEGRIANYGKLNNHKKITQEASDGKETNIRKVSEDKLINVSMDHDYFLYTINEDRIDPKDNSLKQDDYSYSFHITGKNFPLVDFSGTGYKGVVVFLNQEK